MRDDGAAADCVDQNVDGAEFLRHRGGDGVDLDRVERIGALCNGATTGRSQRGYGVIEPRLVNVAAPRPRIEAVRIVDMSSSNSWAEFAALFRSTRPAFLDHERAKGELKSLMPEDAKEVIGHGVRAKRSRSGAVSFDLLETEATRASIQ